MRLVKVKKSFFTICEKERVHSQLMKTKSGRPGVLLFPITKDYIDKYNIDNSKYLLTVNTILDNSTKEIVDACQAYLEKYEKGEKHKFSPDIDGIIRVLDLQKRPVEIKEECEVANP